MSPTQTPEQVELGRFFEVSAREFEAGNAAPEMFSPTVDAAWHRLAGTPEYAPFCHQHARQVFGHVTSHGSGKVSWIRTYEEMFGPLPGIWFTDADGTVDEKAADYYRATGEVWAEWNCSPVPEDPETAPKRRKVTIR
ncbi:hypothetical protein BX264_2433 [Streptomyces sp. 2333.5]|uniref:hypothetical protein n=1 Tax=unclassified Streptomyces TaxID=2593676 RepID=UPI00089CFDD3|nr:MULTISPECIES: hypothetical protein [unclassified Streptomyces]PJJ02103.1 hypothetical protein BX264_2433 [Streptomyces sp. 2333.5]SEC95610.1 hypothetical protein SAMN05428943_2571 [Streptomyces sp. 2314.4]SED81460.1 hypothetical protein SAMN05428942_2535 [Streptomyces sp. 2112.2]SOE13557.1 hypothetical protein SAMN06272775_4538 [Streptomyces sp. 2323.1]